jgi:thiosulfate/3-mercaptopyruvate sulfurtransferase
MTKAARKSILIGFILMSSACAIKPTQVYEKKQAQSLVGKDSPVTVDESVVLIDARTAFEYSSAKVPGSLWLDWQEFGHKEPSMKGVLRADLYREARMLAQKGIGPETSVIVIGNGFQGKAEEGRLAWTLKYLGIKNIHFAPISFFNMPMTVAPAEPRKAVAIWKPAYNESLIVTATEFTNNFKRPIEKRALILDVRSEKEYLGRDDKDRKLNINFEALNIPWQNFLTGDFQINPHIKGQIKALGIDESREIYVISNHGVRSALVTLVLQEQGYKKAANFAGGYLQLQALR